jgi:hypothetical protein
MRYAVQMTWDWLLFSIGILPYWSQISLSFTFLFLKIARDIASEQRTGTRLHWWRGDEMIKKGKKGILIFLFRWNHVPHLLGYIDN